jgi:hypothetical protein
MTFDDAAHRGALVGVEDGAEVGLLPFQHRGEHRRHAHVLVREHDARFGRAGGAQRVQRGHRRLGEAHPLLVVPDVVVLRGGDAELFPQAELEGGDLLLIEARHVDQQDLRRRGDAGVLVDVTPAAKDDAHAEGLLDLAEPAGQRRAVDVIEAAVEHFAQRAQPLLAGVVARPKGADEDVARALIEVDAAGEQALQDCANAADLLDRFVSNVYDRSHGSPSLECDVPSRCEPERRESYDSPRGG